MIYFQVIQVSTCFTLYLFYKLPIVVIKLHSIGNDASFIDYVLKLKAYKNPCISAKYNG